MLNLEFEKRVTNFRGGQKTFSGIFERAAKVLGKMPRFKKISGKVMLAITGDKEVQALNKEYRGLDKPTDVLSFSYFGGKKFPGDDVVGEIVISLPTAKKQAKDHKKTLNEELQFLFLHGLLHVFGFDHIKKKRTQNHVRSAGQNCRE